MNIEVERRFLIKNIFDFDFTLSKICTKEIKELSLEKISQYYFENNTSKISQRVRCEQYESTHKCKYTLNIKSNINGVSRYEFETIINKEDFEFISTNYCNKVLEKYRFNCLIENNKWEINYLPNHKLLIAEIELHNQNQKLNIPFKSYEEITNNSSYLAENLSIKTNN